VTPVLTCSQQPTAAPDLTQSTYTTPDGGAFNFYVTYPKVEGNKLEVTIGYNVWKDGVTQETLERWLENRVKASSNSQWRDHAIAHSKVIAEHIRTNAPTATANIELTTSLTEEKDGVYKLEFKTPDRAKWTSTCSYDKQGKLKVRLGYTYDLACANPTELASQIEELFKGSGSPQFRNNYVTLAKQAAEYILTTVKPYDFEETIVAINGGVEQHVDMYIGVNNRTKGICVNASQAEAGKIVFNNKTTIENPEQLNTFLKNMSGMSDWPLNQCVYMFNRLLAIVPITTPIKIN